LASQATCQRPIGNTPLKYWIFWLTPDTCPSTEHQRVPKNYAQHCEPDKPMCRAKLDLGFVSPKRSHPKSSGSFRQNSLRWKILVLIVASIEPSSTVPGERAPGRFGGFAPNRGGRSADRRWCGSPHPLARLAAKPVPSAEGNGRPITRTGAPIGAPPRRFSFVLETADRGPLYGKPLIPQSFSPCVHPPPPARCRTDPCSWAGQ
jgi:hypothetical protein